MIILVARYKVKPGHGDAVESALREMTPLARQENGCVHFFVSRSQEDSDAFLLFEQYDSEAALARHRETPHFKRIIEGRVVPLLEMRERSLYTPVGA